MNYTAGDFILKKLNLILRSNERIDISRLFVDIQLNEDIFSNTIRGVLTVNDHTDLLSSAPLIGEETIELECYTPGIEDAKHYINHKFQIYKISDRVRVSADSQLYNIHFASTEYLINELNKISTYLSGNPADSILKIFVGEQYLNSKSLLHIPELPENNLTIASGFKVESIADIDPYIESKPVSISPSDFGQSSKLNILLAVKINQSKSDLP